MSFLFSIKFFPHVQKQIQKKCRKSRHYNTLRCECQNGNDAHETDYKREKHLPPIDGGRVLLNAQPARRAEPCRQDVLFNRVIAPRSHRSSIWRRRSFNSSKRFDLVVSCRDKVDKKICRVEPCGGTHVLVGVDTRSPEEGDGGAGSSHGGNLNGPLDRLKNT